MTFKKGKEPWNKGKKGVQKAWNKGIPQSEEHRKHNSESKKGKKQSPETIEKRAIKLRGRSWNWTEESKNKASKSKKEYLNKHPEEIERIKKMNFGRKSSEETKEKQHISHLGNKSNLGKKLPKEQIENIRIGNLGKKRSEEVKENMKKSNYRRGKSPEDGAGWGNGDYHLTPNQGIRWMRSQWELKYASFLEIHGIDYYYEYKRFEMNIGYDTTYAPDFYLPEYNTFIEIKGYWDEETDAKLKSDKFIELYSKNCNYKILFKKELIDLGIDLKSTEPRFFETEEMYKSYRKNKKENEEK